MNPKGFYVRRYIPVEPDDKTLMTLDQAVAEIQNSRFMQPENRYAVVVVDHEGNETEIFNSPWFS